MTLRAYREKSPVSAFWAETGDFKWKPDLLFFTCCLLVMQQKG